MRYASTLGLVALAATALACGAGGDGGADTAGSTGDAPKAAAKAARVGQAVRDGKFEFVVAKPTCGRTSVGPAQFGARAQGVYCLVAVTVKNIGKEAQLFSGSSQKAFDAKGIEFSNDGKAEMFANEGSPTFLEEINPGNRVKGNLIFDVPKGTKLARIELHDSPFSGGVDVALG
ncbi:hypothetical protein GCM10010123_07900 [Pilimelia anulata]|uniref:DUF4352 domain-containing protein n=1 Tax=Pilimelia anulata TaxID=53371 RepID=A0A8J3B3M7_9ACTN|nr:DUF4352 domain-containing protein [Pilimelia anulata]GGJ80390.1 hypothetical protein GCM10010123_07900 [Pilimelia anulata]